MQTSPLALYILFLTFSSWIIIRVAFPCIVQRQRSFIVHPFFSVSIVKDMTFAPVHQTSGHLVTDFVFAASWNTLAVVFLSDEGNDRFTMDAFDWHCSRYTYSLSRLI